MASALLVVDAGELRNIVIEAVRAAGLERSAAHVAIPAATAVPDNGLEATYRSDQVADHLHVDESTVTGWLRKGRLQGSKATGKWLVTASQLAAFEEQRRAEAKPSASPNADEETHRVMQRLFKGP